METLIEELKELQNTLKADGYKSWCYAQLTIDKAINALIICKSLNVEIRENVLIDFAKKYNETRHPLSNPITTVDVQKYLKSIME